MKNILCLGVVLFFCGLSWSQENQTFAQMMLNTELSNDQIRDLDQFIRQQDEIKVGRIDLHTKRIFLLSEANVTLTESMVASWFNSRNVQIGCFYTGTYNVDAIRKYPFQNCED